MVLIHGGPGAAGYMAPLGRELGRSFRVLEPLQRPSGGKPLTVARHVADLQRVVMSLGHRARPALVGHSWGAMLALAYASAHPGRAACLVLIGCGTFDPAERAALGATRDTRLSPQAQDQLNRLPELFPNTDERLAAMERLLEPIYCWAPLPRDEQDMVYYDAQAYEETWADMLCLQGAGVYPAAFGAIRAPVIMLHGGFDPHPGHLIRKSLRPFLAQLEYREWQPCGHYPWREKEVREEFYEVLRNWLTRHTPDPAR